MHASVHPDAFATLFARFLSGQLAPETFQKLMVLFDDQSVSGTDRLAMATFFDDAMGEASVTELKVPVLNEATELLSEIEALA